MFAINAAAVCVCSGCWTALPLDEEGPEEQTEQPAGPAHGSDNAQVPQKQRAFYYYNLVGGLLLL
jgi:hypothetical protein